MIEYMGGKAAPIPLREERAFTMDVSELARLITPRTKLIILNSPQNPTGATLPREDVEQVAQAIGNRNIFVLSDEIYTRLQFEGSPSRSPRCPACSSAPSSSTASRKPMR